jgi:hypothetical protein
MTDRKKPGVAFSASVVVAVMLVGYPLSFGPACWWFSTTEPLGSFLVSVMSSFRGRTYSDYARPSDIFWPLGWAVEHIGEVPSDMLGWYGRIGLPRETAVMIPASRDRSRFVLR